jgi:hypothetical protein
VHAVLAHVRDCDNDERVDNFGANQAFRCLIHLPFDATERSCGVKDILPVVQIKDRMSPP